MSTKKSLFSFSLISLNTRNPPTIKLEQAAIQIAAGITQSYFLMTPSQQGQQLSDWKEMYGGDTTVKAAISKDAKQIALALFEELETEQ